MRLVAVLEAAGITRDELRAVVLQRQEEERQAEQARVDAELLRLGEEFKRERREQPRVVTKPKPVAAPSIDVEPSFMKKTCDQPELPPLIETEGCAAFLCTNAAHTTVVRVYSGRALRVRYCRPHADEVQIEKLAAAGGLNGRRT